MWTLSRMLNLLCSASFRGPGTTDLHEQASFVGTHPVSVTQDGHLLRLRLSYTSTFDTFAGEHGDQGHIERPLVQWTGSSGCTRPRGVTYTSFPDGPC